MLLLVVFCRQNTLRRLKKPMFTIDKSIPLYEQVYFNLKKLILDGELKPKYRLIDTKIAKDLSISRSPVREALRMLEQEKLVTNINGVLTVYNPSLTDVIELYKVRTGLEYVATYWATKYIDNHSLEDLQDSLERVEKFFKAGDYEKVIEMNTYFHDTIVNASKNNYLQTIMKTNRSLILLCRKILFKNIPINLNFIEEHQVILEAMIKRNQLTAAQRIESHIYNDLNHFKSIFYEQEANNFEN